MGARIMSRRKYKYPLIVILKEKHNDYPVLIQSENGLFRFAIDTFLERVRSGWYEDEDASYIESLRLDSTGEKILNFLFDRQSSEYEDFEIIQDPSIYK